MSLFNSSAFAQETNDSSLPKTKDTIQHASQKKMVDSNKKNHTLDTVKQLKRQKAISRPDTIKRTEISSIKNLVVHTPNLKNDSLAKNVNPVSASDTLIKSAQTTAKTASFVVEQLLLKNRFINVKDPPVFFEEQPHQSYRKEFLFYSLCLIVLILGIFKSFYKGFFGNLFRVYFNTSLRQTQLADQLSQAKLPSFILNLFFVITAGVYIWLLFNIYNPSRLANNKFLLAFCMLIIALLYFIKFCLLKFTGWVSDISQTTNNYIFVIFLVNKITGILLVPVIILLAFLQTAWIPVVANISFMILGLLFLSRYIKSYGALDKKLPMNAFHFILFILAAEIIPLILIYKIAIDYLI
ncbi:MAG TPA: DUF4271 domain-containing protein [Hanamia sp.]